MKSKLQQQTVSRVIMLSLALRQPRVASRSGYSSLSCSLSSDKRTAPNSLFPILPPPLCHFSRPNQPDTGKQQREHFVASHVSQLTTRCTALPFITQRNRNGANSESHQIGNCHIFLPFQLSKRHFAKKRKRLTSKRPDDPLKFDVETHSNTKAKSSKARPQSGKWTMAKMQEMESAADGSGTNGVFLRCAQLLGHSPGGVFYMMNSLNVSLMGVGLASLFAFTMLDGYDYYHVPFSAFISWALLKCVADAIPLMPALYAQFAPIITKSHPILAHCRFSRKMPDPSAQSVKAILLGTGVAKHDLTAHLKKPYSRYRIFKLRGASKHGLAYDCAENLVVSCMFPLLFISLQTIGISDQLVEAFVYAAQSYNPPNAVSSSPVLSAIGSFLATNDWMITILDSFAASTIVCRITGPFIFRFYCLPAAESKFGIKKKARY